MPGWGGRRPNAWRRRHRLPFPILSSPSSSVRRRRGRYAAATRSGIGWAELGADKGTARGMAETETPSLDRTGRSRPSTLARIVIWTVLCLAGGVVCASAASTSAAPMCDARNYSAALERTLSGCDAWLVSWAARLRPRA